MFGWEDQRTHTERTRDALTSSKKNKIKALIGKCESCGKKFDDAHMDVNHIIEAASANGTTDLNRPGNLVVLCPNCHRFFHSGDITKTALKSKVSKRSERIKKELKAILKGRPLVTDRTGGSRFIDSPPPFLTENPFIDESPKPKRKTTKKTTTLKKKRPKRGDDHFIIRF